MKSINLIIGTFVSISVMLALLTLSCVKQSEHKTPVTVLENGEHTFIYGAYHTAGNRVWVNMDTHLVDNECDSSMYCEIN